MKSKLWKIYFWFLLLTILSVVIMMVYDAGKHIFAFITDAFFITFSILSVYSFIYKKNYLSGRFWKILFWLNIVYYLISIIYALAPAADLIKYLSIFSQTGKPVPLPDVIIGALFPIPLLYSTYQISEGKFLNKKAKIKIKTSAKNKIAITRWNMVQTALWGYSIVFTSIVLLTLFITSGNSSVSTNPLYGIIAFIPLLAFWLAVILKYKQYRWNWWKTTLVLNSIFYVGLITIGIFSPASQTETIPAGTNYISIAELLIMLSSLIVLGRERLSKQD